MFRAVGRLSYGGFMAPAAEATRAADAIRNEVGEGGADVLVTFRSKELTASRPAFREAVEDALRRAPKGTVDGRRRPGPRPIRCWSPSTSTRPWCPSC
ncbi:hypothetical protein GCM10017744_021210 [Streptomyces antimycoticus]